MTRVRILALLLMAALTPFPWSAAFAQGQYAGGAERLELTLDEAIGLALRNNRSLLDARLGRSIQKLSLDVAEDRYRPTLRIEPSVRAQNNERTAADLSSGAALRVATGGQLTLRWSEALAGGDDTSGTVTLGFSQPLLRGFGVGIDTAPLRVARLSDRINALAFREAVSGVVVSTIGAWRSLVRVQRQLEIGEASLDHARKQLETNRKLIEAGQMAAREILQSEADIAGRELGLIESRNSVTAANFGLIDILDIDSATVILPVDRPSGQRPVPSVAEAIETALTHSPGYTRALLDREIAEIDLELARNDRLWDLSLDTEASRAIDGGRGTEYSARMRLSIPLGDRSPRLTLVRAKAKVEQAERGLVELRQAMDIAVRQAVYDVEIGLKRIELARQSRLLTEEKLRIERSKLQQGLSSNFQLSQFEDDWVQSQNAEVDAFVNYENALTALDQTLGTTLETWKISVEQAGR